VRYAPLIGSVLLILALPATAQDVAGDGGLDGGISDTEICDNCNPAIVDFDAWGVGPQDRPDAGTIARRRRRPDTGGSTTPEPASFGCSGAGLIGLEPLLLLAFLRRRKKFLGKHHG